MYRQNPHLQDYVLVDAEAIAVELFRKNNADTWQIINYQAGDLVELQSVNLSFSIEQIYEDITFLRTEQPF